MPYGILNLALFPPLWEWKLTLKNRVNRQYRPLIADYKQQNYTEAKIKKRIKLYMIFTQFCVLVHVSNVIHCSCDRNNTNERIWKLIMDTEIKTWTWQKDKITPSRVTCMSISNTKKYWICFLFSLFLLDNFIPDCLIHHS